MTIGDALSPSRAQASTADSARSISVAVIMCTFIWSTATRIATAASPSIARDHSGCPEISVPSRASRISPMPLQRRKLGLRVRHQMSGENGARFGTDNDGARLPDAGMQDTPGFVAMLALLVRRGAAKDSCESLMDGRRPFLKILPPMRCEARLASHRCAKPSLNPCRPSRSIVKLLTHETDSARGAIVSMLSKSGPRRPLSIIFNEGFVPESDRRVTH
jgi:hypothetical protein